MLENTSATKKLLDLNKRLNYLLYMKTWDGKKTTKNRKETRKENNLRKIRKEINKDTCGRDKN